MTERFSMLATAQLIFTHPIIPKFLHPELPTWRILHKTLAALISFKATFWNMCHHNL